MMYGATPALILGWIPYVWVVGVAWSIVVQIIGVRQLHGIPMQRAVAAYMISLAIPLIIFGIVISAVYSPTVMAG
jgi:hypothetical protein